ncbi:MAG TPA: hypothetical protein VJP02_18655 [Candidatus Sulfotelmatobacter sp.]|nr:hypothetical protein [Candidatus Sulfotelmatobacter sp.]
MNSARVLYHMVRADFLERVRRYSFLLTLAGALWVAYGVATEEVWIVVGDGYRGVYNSAWIGALMAICCSTFLSLAGFYIVKNSVQRDTDTRVGQILAATPMRRDFYTVAKALSNFAVLACMVGILMVAAVAMQLMRAEAHSFSLWKLWAPFIFIALPTMLLAASTAVFFETLPLLRGGVGNVVYFFVWTAALALGATGLDDPTGLQLLYRSSRQTLHAIDPAGDNNFHFSLTIGGQHAVRTFPWNGIEWTANVLLIRLGWIAAAVAVAYAASIFFHRFDPARSWFKRRTASVVAPSASAVEESAASQHLSAAHLSPIPQTGSGVPFFRIVAAELRLMLKGKRWWWYLVAAGLAVASLFTPFDAARGGVLVAAWLWPIFVWSPMGSREACYATESLIFSSTRALSRQLPAIWSAGVLVALFAGGGVGLRLLIHGDHRGFLAWFAGAAFIPTLALALGVWTGGSKAFEAIYIIWWYMGPAHHIPGIDFMGTTAASSTPIPYLIATVFLLGAAYLRRRSRLAYA